MNKLFDHWELYDLGLKQGDSAWEFWFPVPKLKVNWEVISKLELGDWIVLLITTSARPVSKAVEKSGVTGAKFYYLGEKDIIAVVPTEQFFKIVNDKQFYSTFFDSQECSIDDILQLLREFRQDAHPNPFQYDKLLPAMQMCKSQILYILNDDLNSVAVSESREVLLEVAAESLSQILRKGREIESSLVDSNVMRDVFTDDVQFLRMSSKDMDVLDSLASFKLWDYGVGAQEQFKQVRIDNTQAIVSDWQMAPVPYHLKYSGTALSRFLSGVGGFLFLVLLVAIPVAIIYGLYKLVSLM